MAANRRKRRCASFVHECLIRKVSRALVEGDQRAASATIRILKRAFKPGTELHRELKLARALLNVTVASHALAANIIDEARSAAAGFDARKLDREKSLLIRNINHNLRDPELFEATIPGYRMHATVGALLSEWRAPAGTRDISRLAEHESRLADWLTAEKPKEGPEITLAEESRADLRLLQRAMVRKIDERYSSSLTPAQKEIVRLHALALARGVNEPLVRKLEEVKRSTLVAIDARMKSAPDDAFANAKLSEVRERLVAEDLTALDDALVSRFMLHEKLRAEMESREDEGEQA